MKICRKLLDNDKKIFIGISAPYNPVAPKSFELCNDCLNWFEAAVEKFVINSFEISKEYYDTCNHKYNS